MREFSFREEVRAEIRHDCYHHPHPRVQRKMEVLGLKSLGLTHADIAAFADVSPRCLCANSASPTVVWLVPQRGSIRRSIRPTETSAGRRSTWGALDAARRLY